LVLGMARLAALEASRVSGRLVLLDTAPATADTSPLDLAAPPQLRAAFEAEARGDFDHARADFFDRGDFHEADYSVLEFAGNRLHAVRQAGARGVLLRDAARTLIPSRAARRTDIVVPELSPAAVAAQLASARSRARAFADGLSQLYSYNLITRNCVSEIFATIDAAFARLPAVQARVSGAAGMTVPEAVRLESRQRLGGFVETRGTLNFIPFVSAATVEAQYAVAGRAERPSYRALRLADLRSREGSWRVAWRESNTLTSTIYFPDRNDSTFLFFTDDRVWPRPLLGALNLAVGLGESALGLLTLPLDGAQRLRAGLRGTLFSLPELAFVNIRKGSMAFVARAATPFDAEAPTATGKSAEAWCSAYSQPQQSGGT
jgi:hypothetical protein